LKLFLSSGQCVVKSQHCNDGDTFSKC
jgi:hypothetical protein